jgi:hypothetical protein
MADIIQVRRDTATNWTNINPILAQGEIGEETDTKKIKIGDGITDWNNLDYTYYDTIIFIQQEITGTGTNNIDWNQGLKAKVTLTADTTLTFTNPTQAYNMTLEIIQDSTGGHTLTLPTILWQGGVSPTLLTAANNKAVISLYYNGSEYKGMGINFS